MPCVCIAIFVKRILFILSYTIIIIFSLKYYYRSESFIETGAVAKSARPDAHCVI